MTDYECHNDGRIDAVKILPKRAEGLLKPWPPTNLQHRQKSIQRPQTFSQTYNSEKKSILAPLCKIVTKIEVSLEFL